MRPVRNYDPPVKALRESNVGEILAREMDILPLRQHIQDYMHCQEKQYEANFGLAANDENGIPYLRLKNKCEELLFNSFTLGYYIGEHMRFEANERGEQMESPSLNDILHTFVLSGKEEENFKLLKENPELGEYLFEAIRKLENDRQLNLMTFRQRPDMYEALLRSQDYFFGLGVEAGKSKLLPSENLSRITFRVAE